MVLLLLWHHSLRDSPFSAFTQSLKATLTSTNYWPCSHISSRASIDILVEPSKSCADIWQLVSAVAWRVC